LFSAFLLAHAPLPWFPSVENPDFDASFAFPNIQKKIAFRGEGSFKCGGPVFHPRQA